MKHEQLVIGFDAREMWLRLSVIWPQERRKAFLLREDIEKPLATDTIVWQSLFHSHRAIISKQSVTTGSATNLELPAEHRSIDNLWTNLEAMQTYLQEAPTLEGKSYWLIAIAELMSLQDKERLKQTYSFIPLEVDPKWKLLGFDVSQNNLTSGLTNESYAASEIEALKVRWSPHLNKHHLFTEEEQADAFADWADERDVGHAPYHVYAIYLVSKHSD